MSSPRVELGVPRYKHGPQNRRGHRPEVYRQKEWL